MKTLTYIATFIALATVTCLSIHSSRDNSILKGGTLTKEDTFTETSAHNAAISAGNLGYLQESQ